jgi:spermidine synthase
MSDTRMEKVFSGEVVDKAHGSVLVAGLGLGMVIFPILEKKEVKMVTVVELNYDVIKLVKPRVKSPKLRIIHSDIAVWLPPKGEKYNTIFFDIWPTICQDNLQEVAILHQAFKNRLDRSDPECWMGSWCAHYLRGQRRKEKR